VQGTQVGVLKEPDDVCLGRLVQREHGIGLEAHHGLIASLRDLAHQPLEGLLADQQLGGLLVRPDLAKLKRWGCKKEEKRVSVT
jgi:hypothetical protein